MVLITKDREITLPEEWNYVTIQKFISEVYAWGRADTIEECLQRVKDRLLTYSVGDDVIIDFNLLEDELLEIMEQLKEQTE